MIRKNNESLFLRYRLKGLRVSNDLREQIIEFIEISKGEKKDSDILNELVKYSKDFNGIGIDCTWFHLIKELYKIFDTPVIIEEFDLKQLYNILSILSSEKAIEEVWVDLKKYILENIDILSMWNNSNYRISAERTNIKRIANDKYICYFNEEEYEIIGEKSFEEEKFDYIMSNTLGGYGYIYRLIRFISLYFISVDFRYCPEKYPHCINIILPENDREGWFLSWNWSMERLYGYSRIGWRPQSNYCDPDWLVSDLLINYSDEMLKKRKNIIYDKPKDKNISLYEMTFEGFSFQLSSTIDTELIIGEEDEAYFEFKDRKIRWINGTIYEHAVIVIPVKDIKDTTLEQNLLNEFVSSLVWETEVPIRIKFSAAGHKRFLPLTSTKKNRGGFVHNNIQLKYNKSEIGKDESLALALYKEGINSRNNYYAALNYYKIIELFLEGAGRHGSRMIDWISKKREILIKRYEDRVREIEEIDARGLGNYIYGSCRCAIAHAGQIDETVNPDEINDINRITKDVFLLKELAKDIIKSGGFKRN